MTLSEVWREAPLVFGCLYLDFGDRGFLRGKGAEIACKDIYFWTSARVLKSLRKDKNKFGGTSASNGTRPRVGAKEE